MVIVGIHHRGTAVEIWKDREAVFDRAKPPGLGVVPVRGQGCLTNQIAGLKCRGRYLVELGDCGFVAGHRPHPSLVSPCRTANSYDSSTSSKQKIPSLDHRYALEVRIGSALRYGRSVKSTYCRLLGLTHHSSPGRFLKEFVASTAKTPPRPATLILLDAEDGPGEAFTTLATCPDASTLLHQAHGMTDEQGENAAMGEEFAACRQRWVNLWQVLRRSSQELLIR